MIYLNIFFVCTVCWLVNYTQGATISTNNNGQDLPSIQCHSDEKMKEYYDLNKNALKEMQQFEITSRQFLMNRKASNSYVIPVVFHVYGTDFMGTTVNDTTIIRALEKLNDDFHGLNKDFNSVHSAFQNHRSTMDVTFKLARKDPNGKATTGIIYYPAKGGYGLNSVNSEIQKDAWDNYKYCNVYVQLDLYNNDGYTSSGVAWYPDSSMSDDNLARIVYNGRYLYGNTDEEFSSVLTHEFGHWLNLIHTFEDGCTHSSESQCDQTGDRICDTPQTVGNEGCNPINNCAGKLINSENYMDYSGAYGCYKMFTAGQVARMEAAMQHPARFTLWQTKNLIATGLLDNTTVDPCSSNPCMNEGACVSAGDIFVCACKPTWTGLLCNTPLGTTSTTSTTGSSTTTTKTKTTTTTTTITTTPVSNSTQCSPNPCLNGGKCYKVKDSYVCVCSAPYTGLLCDQIITTTPPMANTSNGQITCAQKPCKNGSTCYNVGTSYFCYCGTGANLTGKNCESSIKSRGHLPDNCPLDCGSGECVRTTNQHETFACLCDGLLKSTTCTK